MPPQSLLLARAAKVRATSVSHLGLKVLDQIHYVFKMKFTDINDRARECTNRIDASRISRIFCELPKIVNVKKVLNYLQQVCVTVRCECSFQGITVTEFFKFLSRVNG